MKFSCFGDLLKQAVSIVEKSVSTRNTLPIMENIYFELNGNQLKLRGNDLEMGIEYILPIESIESLGSVLIKAKTISSILNKLTSNQVIQFNSDSTNKVMIHLDKIDFEILGSSTQEYPMFPEIENGVQFQLNASELQSMIKDTIFSVSHEETKQFLNGLLFKKEDESIVMISTDGYRLSLKRVFIQDISTPFQVIIPRKIATELLRILQGINGDTAVQINITPTQISFKLPNLLLLSRVIQGQFPDYNQVLPSQFTNIYTVSRRLLLSACERAEIIVSSVNNIVRFYINQNLVIKSNSVGMGGFREEVIIERKEGVDSLRAAFNVKFIIDVLRNIESDDVQIEFNNDSGPCVIRPIGQREYVYVIMPLRIGDFEQNDEQKNEVVDHDPVTVDSEF